MRISLLAGAAATILLTTCGANDGQDTSGNTAAASSLPTGPTLEGVWKRVETIVESGPNRGTHIADVQPSVFIFVDGYFSVNQIEGYAPRPRLSDNPSDEERGRIFGDFTGYAGTYSLDGAALSISRVVSKNPNLTGLSQIFLVEWVGNDFWLTMPTHDGPQARVRLARFAYPVADERLSQ